MRQCRNEYHADARCATRATRRRRGVSDEWPRVPHVERPSRQLPEEMSCLPRQRQLFTRRRGQGTVSRRLARRSIPRQSMRASAHTGY